MKNLFKNNKWHAFHISGGLLMAAFLLALIFSNLPLTSFKADKVAEAYVIDGTEYPESAFPNVARLFDSLGNDHCTGTLIDSTHVLTAAHCFFDGANRDVLGSDMTVRLNGKTYASKNVYINSKYDPKNNYCVEGKTDAAIIELATSVPASVATPAVLYTTKLAVGSALTIAGYGLTGASSDGSISMESYMAPPIGKIYAGTTAVEGFGLRPTELNNNSEYIYWTLDSGEATTAPGDSGGPGFYNKKLASVTSCGSGNLLGGLTQHTRIDKLAPWINNVLSGKITATPDPVKPPFVYDDGGGFKLTFTDSVTIGGHKVFMDTIEYNSYPKEDGTYNLMAFMGAYGKDSDMNFYNTLSKAPNFTMLYKKKGTSNYIEEMKVTRKVDPHSDDKTQDGYKIGMIRYEIGTYDSPNPLVEPGEYTISVFNNSKVITSADICLPSFTSKTGVKIGKITCPGTTSQSSPMTGTQSSNPFIANGPGSTGTQNPNGSQTANGGNSKAYTATIGDPIFIKGANADLAQFNVPLLYKLAADPTNKTKVMGSLQTVIYKKKELKKIEAVAALDTQNILFNTQSMYSYQWSGLEAGNEYVVYFYDKTTDSKSSYIGLKYGGDGKLVATKISSLPPWTADVSVAANGGNSNGGNANNNTNNNANQNSQNQALQNAAALTSVITTKDGVTVTFKADPKYVAGTAGDDVIKVNGIVKYSSELSPKPSLATLGAGSGISVSLFDKAGKNIPGVGKPLPAASIVYDKEIPIGIDLNAKIAAYGNTTSTGFKVSDGPFTIKITDTKLEAVSKAFNVGQASAVSTPQESTSIVNGEPIVFKIKNANANMDTGKLELDGTIAYNHTLSTNEVSAKKDRVAIEIIDNSGEKLTGLLTVSSVDNKTLSIKNSNKMFGFELADAPFTFKIKDNNISAVSSSFTLDVSGSGGAVIMSGAYAGKPATVNGTTTTFEKPAITSGDVTSAIVNSSVSYVNSAKTGKVTDAAVFLKLYNVDSTGKLTANGNPLPVTVNAEYGKKVTASGKISGLNAAQKFAVQFVDTKYGNATSDVKIIEAKDGKFVEAAVQPADAPASDPAGNNSSDPTKLESPLRDGLNTIPGIVTVLVDDIVIPIAVPLLALAILWTGFLFIQARGKPEKIKEAKTALQWTLIGGAIILGAYVIATALQATVADIVKK